MNQIDFIGRLLTVITVIGFLLAGIFDVLNNFIVKLLLVGSFVIVVVYLFMTLIQNENHPKP